MKKDLTSIWKVCFLVSIIASLMALFMNYKLNKYGGLVYIWNLFLGWIPFVFSLIISKIYFSKENKKISIKVCVLLFIWIIFYPNAPYIVTDFIHINTHNYAFQIKDTLEMGRNFWMWYHFILIALFAWIGFIIGFISLYLNQIIIKKQFNKIISWIFVIISLFASGYGIYLGRFVRFNTWDIFINPLNLFKYIIADMSFVSIAFSSIFGLFLLLTYILLYNIANLHLEKHNYMGE